MMTGIVGGEIHAREEARACVARVESRVHMQSEIEDCGATE